MCTSDAQAICPIKADTDGQQSYHDIVTGPTPMSSSSMSHAQTHKIKQSISQYTGIPSMFEQCQAAWAQHYFMSATMPSDSNGKHARAVDVTHTHTLNTPKTSIASLQCYEITN